MCVTELLKQQPGFTMQEEELYTLAVHLVLKASLANNLLGQY
jgi:hypothetical protein